MMWPSAFGQQTWACSTAWVEAARSQARRMASRSAVSMPYENIVFLVALGTHRPQTEEELIRLVSPEVFARVRVVNHDDVKAVNTETAPDTVKPTRGEPGGLDGGCLTVRIPSLSWNVIRLVKA